MRRTIANCDYDISGISDYPYNTPDSQINVKYLPATYAIEYCMKLTGITKIIDKESLHEFLVRLAVSLSGLNIIDNWFLDYRLFDYDLNRQHFSLSAEDIFRHMGIEASGKEKRVEQESRRLFIERMKTAMPRKSIKTMQLEMGLQILPFERKWLTRLEPLPPAMLPDLSDSYFRNAEIFAEDVLRIGGYGSKLESRE